VEEVQDQGQVGVKNLFSLFICLFPLALKKQADEYVLNSLPSFSLVAVKGYFGNLVVTPRAYTYIGQWGPDGETSLSESAGLAHLRIFAGNC